VRLRGDPRRFLATSSTWCYFAATIRLVGKWVRIDRRSNYPYRLTRYAKRVITTWVIVAIVAFALVNATHGWFAIPAGVSLVGFTGYRVRSSRRGLLAGHPAVQPAARLSAHAVRFNPAPKWPVSVPGWTPPPGWQPDPSWPEATPGWQFWVPDCQAPVGERNTRSIPQDVKIAVAARDGGRCRQCGSTTDLHFDHVIPWSKGGANTVANIQLLCGPCNRRKGADDIPACI
jgi:5-methylcytosine-specific restriction endonuclease McrA